MQWLSKPIQNYFKNIVERIHTGGDGEYGHADVQEHMEITPYTSQKNPCLERFNRTWLDPVRGILEHVGLFARYWEYALEFEFMTYLKNRSTHSAIILSPFERITGKKLNLGHITVFGCADFVYEHFPKI